MTPTSWLCVMGDAGYIYPHWLYLQCVLWPQHAPRGRLPSYKRKSILEWNGISVKFWNGMEWNTENLEYYSSFWSILLNSIRVFRKSWYSENIQDYREKLYSSSIRVLKKVDIQKISRNTEKNCIRVVLRSTDVFSGTKRKKKNVLLTDTRDHNRNLNSSASRL